MYRVVSKEYIAETGLTELSSSRAPVHPVRVFHRQPAAKRDLLRDGRLCAFEPNIARNEMIRLGHELDESRLCPCLQ